MWAPEPDTLSQGSPGAATIHPSKDRALRLDDVVCCAQTGVVPCVCSVDKRRTDAVLKADYAAFTGVADFIVGYGMDDAGNGRGLPYIARLA